MMEFIWPILLVAIGVTIAILAAWRIWVSLRERREGFPTKDERTMRIQGRAASYAIMVGSYFMILLLFYNMFIIEFLGWQELGSLPALNSSIIVMNLTYLGLQRYYGGKEDI
jgi:cytochrome b561